MLAQPAAMPLDELPAFSTGLCLLTLLPKCHYDELSRRVRPCMALRSLTPSEAITHGSTALLCGVPFIPWFPPREVSTHSPRESNKPSKQASKQGTRPGTCGPEQHFVQLLLHRQPWLDSIDTKKKPTGTAWHPVRHARMPFCATMLMAP